MSLRVEISDSTPPSIKFVCKKFLFVPDSGYIHWDKIVDAIKNNQAVKLELNPSCYIEVNDRYVYFSMSVQYHYFIFTMKSEKCLEAFETADAIYKRIY